MNTVKTKMIAATALVLFSAGFKSAHAVCVQEGILVSHAQSAVNSTLFLQNDPYQEVFWSCGTNNARIQATANAAAARNVRVKIQGNATSCPTTGKFRNMGSCFQMTINP